MKTKDRLAAVLRAEGLPHLADAAARGGFDDFESPSATPIVDLVRALEAAGRTDLADRARNGEWDGTAEEARAWAEREVVSASDVGDFLREIGLGTIPPGEATSKGERG